MHVREAHPDDFVASVQLVFLPLLLQKTILIRAIGRNRRLAKCHLMLAYFRIDLILNRVH